MPPLVKFDKLLNFIAIFCSGNKNSRDFIKTLLLNYEII